jgi:tetratricopeptide (TPR) repeat protein
LHYHQSVLAQLDRAGTNADYLHHGDDQFHLGNIEAAIANYSQAIKMAPSKAGLYCARGIVRHVLGDTKNALIDYDTAIQVSSQRWAPAFSGRADIEISLGNYDAAIADLNRAHHH